MLKRILAFGAVFILCLIAFFVLVNVTPKDVVAYNNLKAHVGSSTFKAGDLVRISPDGQTVQSTLCSLAIEDDDLTDFPLSKDYSNSLRDTLPDFTKLVDWGKGMLGMPGNGAPELSAPMRVSFEGRVTSLKNEGVKAKMDADCACRVAEAQIKRFKVCSVLASLIETKLRPSVINDPNSDLEVFSRTIGATFRPGSVFIPDVKRLNCPNLSDLNQETQQSSDGFDCSTFGRFPVDVMMRDKLGFIRETDRPADEET